jgi:basic membrane protein A
MSAELATFAPLRARLNRRQLLVGSTAAIAATTVGSTASAQDASPAGDPFRVAFVYLTSPSDLGYAWAHDQGRIALENAIPGVETAYWDGVPDNDQVEAARAIRAIAEDGYDLIVTNSSGHAPAVIAVAPDFPDTQFITIGGDQIADNVSTAFGKIEEPRYVSGFLAARMATSGNIGFVAAFPIPQVIRGINAFTLGAQAANPDARVHVAWTSSWFDPEAERAAAESLLEQGAEVIAQHQNTADPLKAAEAAGKYGIGYNVDMSDQAPEAVLTSAVWNWGTYYIWAVEQIMAGTWQANQYWGSWADGVVDLAPLADFVPADIAAETNALADEFRSGSRGITDMFTGPIRKQDGTDGVPAGSNMTDEEILAMDWFVAGVEGSADVEATPTPA